MKLWKKRYFVLSEYCLSYYKSAHDDKTSGSILLPSYRISPVSKEDGIPRKFAFKAEHHNMRTYYFAADSQTNMIQWMNALSLASILQSDKRYESVTVTRISIYFFNNLFATRYMSHILEDFQIKLQ